MNKEALELILAKLGYDTETQMELTIAELLELVEVLGNKQDNSPRGWPNFPEIPCEDGTNPEPDGNWMWREAGPPTPTWEWENDYWVMCYD